MKFVEDLKIKYPNYAGLLDLITVRHFVSNSFPLKTVSGMGIKTPYKDLKNGLKNVNESLYKEYFNAWESFIKTIQDAITTDAKIKFNLIDDFYRMGFCIVIQNEAECMYLHDKLIEIRNEQVKNKDRYKLNKDDIDSLIRNKNSLPYKAIRYSDVGMYERFTLTNISNNTNSIEFPISALDFD